MVECCVGCFLFRFGLLGDCLFTRGLVVAELWYSFNVGLDLACLPLRGGLLVASLWFTRGFTWVGLGFTLGADLVWSRRRGLVVAWTCFWGQDHLQTNRTKTPLNDFF